MAHQLAAWRVRDHGAVVAVLGGRDQPQPHVVEQTLNEAAGGGLYKYYVVPVPEPSSFRTVLAAALPFTSLEEAVMRFDDGAQVVTAHQQVRPGKEVIVGAVRPRHSPHQLIVLAAYVD